jgi:hypothetical protein
MTKKLNVPNNSGSSLSFEIFLLANSAIVLDFDIRISNLERDFGARYADRAG